MTEAVKAIRGAIAAAAPDGLLPWAAQQAVAEQFDLSLAEVEEIALQDGILPARYQRNRQSISVAEQLTLFRSRATIVGCGGLGGYIIEELARLGVGTLTLIDPDIFEEHNLNRQLLSSPETVGRPKATVAGERVNAINPAVSVTVHQIALDAKNGKELIQGSTLVMDALDSITTRLELARRCKELSIPFIHGAIAGWYGQVAVQMPGDDLTLFIAGNSREAKGIEKQLGNPAFTPATVASLQTAEACKVLLGKGTTLRGRVLCLNLLDMEFDEIRF